MIEIINLTKNYGSIEAIKNLSFSAKKGEIIGFLGPNGAGKSTTMNIITGYIPSTDGTVKVCGFDILEAPREVKKHIGYLPERTPIHTNMTVMEFLNFISDLKLVDKKNKKSHIEEILKKLNLIDVKNRLIKNLSNGYKQRVGIAQAIVGNPDVIILDEPTVGLDPKQIIEIRNLIAELGKDHTIIFSSHILSEVSAICHKVVIINKGQVVAIDTPENLCKKYAGYLKIQVKIIGDEHIIENTILNINGVEKVQLKEIEGKAINYVIEVRKDEDVREAIFYSMVKAGFPILESKVLDISLEDIFVKLINDQKEVKL